MPRAELERLAEIVRAAPGLQAKRHLRLVAEAFPARALALGDDGATVPVGDGHVVTTGEAVWPPLVRERPFAAGVAAVNATVADVRAMGGRAEGVTTAVVAPTEEHAREVLRGVADGAALLGVAVDGGHLTLGNEPALSAFARGRARALLSSAAARAGDEVLLATCLDGGYLDDLPFFSSLRGRAPELVAGDGEPLAVAAERGLCACARDVSMPGVAGSLLQLLEASGAGAVLDVERLPRPPEVPLERWLVTFPSYGFLLCAAPASAPAVREAFVTRDLACEVVGKVDASGRLRLASGTDEALVWDLRAEPLTGLGHC
jgi:uncharacterized protein